MLPRSADGNGRLNTDIKAMVMSFSRREVVLLGMGLLLSGCNRGHRSGDSAHRPGPLWPDGVTSPTRAQAGVVLPPTHPTGGASPGTAAGPTPVASGPAVAGLAVIARSRWAKAEPIKARLNPMGSIERITVHHEGWTPVYFTGMDDTAARMESIRRSHLERMNSGDIGYHLVIDRAGRLWQGRDLAYQGAHVREHNPKNIGIMCLGNFDLQRPSDAQLASLRQALGKLAAAYRVRPERVFSHQELMPTACPGKDLQGRFTAMRRNGYA